MLFDVEDGLEHDSNTPEHRHVCAETACQGASTGEFARVADAQGRERDDRQHDVTAVDPVHLPVEPRQASQFVAPVQLERHQGGRNENAHLPDTREKNQTRESGIHQIAPRTRMNGTMTPTTNGRWNSRPTGASNATIANRRPLEPLPNPIRRPASLRSTIIPAPWIAKYI